MTFNLCECFGPPLNSSFWSGETLLWSLSACHCAVNALCTHACGGITRPEPQAFDHILFSVAEERRHNQRNVGLDPGGGSSSLCPQSVRCCSAELCKHPDQHAFSRRWQTRHWWRRQRWTILVNVSSLWGSFPDWIKLCNIPAGPREVRQKKNLQHYFISL